MKKLLLSAALLLALSMTFTSCRDTKKADSAGEAMEAAADDAAEATEGAMEEVGKAIDNAAEETKEAGEAVGDAVDKIDGNDN